MFDKFNSFLRVGNIPSNAGHFPEVSQRLLGITTGYETINFGLCI